jgi:CHAT domain-containing protein
LLAERQGLATVLPSDLWARHQVLIGAAARAETVLRMAEEEYETARATPNESQAELAVYREKADKARVDYLEARYQADQLWRLLSERAPRAFAPILNMEQAGHALPDETVYLSFSWTDHGLVTFILYRDTDGKVILEPNPFFMFGQEPGGPKFIREKIDKFRREVSDRESPLEDIVPAARSIFFWLLVPGHARDVVLKAKHLVIAPDGPLWGLPFAALVVNDDGPPVYLGDLVAITYTQSFRVYQQARAEPPRLSSGTPPNALVVGDPRLDRPPGPHEATSKENSFALDGGRALPALPAAEVEARQVAGLYQSEPILGTLATKAEVRRRIEAADVIEFATHGVLDQSVAMSSGILLAGPEATVANPDNEGILQAWEIFSQFKLRAEIVVLSACQSALGDMINGEGIVGLTYAFQYAGARSIVASQWQVGDESTAELMVSFHGNLRGGLAKDEALRQAMRSVRQNSRTAKPYYWAPFILQGNSENTNLAIANEHGR